MVNIIKKTFVIFLITLLFICIGNLFENNISNAAWKWNIKEYTTGANDESGASEKVRTLMDIAIVVVRVVSTGVAVIMLIVLGTKYMLAAPGDRASIIKHAYVYLVGAVLMFGCSGILGIISSFAKGS